MEQYLLEGGHFSRHSNSSLLNIIESAGHLKVDAGESGHQDKDEYSIGASQAVLERVEGQLIRIGNQDVCSSGIAARNGRAACR